MPYEIEVRVKLFIECLIVYSNSIVENEKEILSILSEPLRDEIFRITRKSFFE